ncbi:lipopolysaccharide biosynthesis protein [Pararcticibacter amylolyticus]|uniref:Polysaccharide biosynthesis protein n=1 Tax=Pararcticibacter amylolyticus TaxID=2173175 RepID=A0A2U2PBR9_9SPHI|nr:hypothetical protein [Pararcticibacter amylolyticus]PWG78810.1 hypothetical protein DDR33_20510 [Pararcticibacter amylolyticus]
MQLLLRLYGAVRGLRTSNDRTNTVLINTLSSLFLKGISILINFILVPLCLNAITEKEYGLVLTITSIVNWISFFDIGIGNGLRNKLSQAIAENNPELGRRYVSTAFYYVTIIFLSILVLYTIVHPLINWHGLLHISSSEVPELSLCIYIVIAIFIVRFILQLISMILLADQKGYLSDAIMPIANVITILLIFILYKSGHANFYNLMLSMSITPIIVLIGYNFFFFNGSYKFLRPSIKFIDHSLRKSLLTLGYQFFLLQICVIIIFSTSEFLVANLFDMQSVTTFNIASRYYGIVFLLSNMVMAPLWSAFTNAWYQGDISWIIKMVKRMHFMNLLFLAVNICLFFAFEPLVKLWLGRSFHIHNHLALSLIIYNTQMIFNNVFVLFLNGIGRLKSQLWCGISGAIINIPITILLARYTELGLTSICLANIISLIPSSIVVSIQTRKILSARSGHDNEL